MKTLTKFKLAFIAPAMVAFFALPVEAQYMMGDGGWYIDIGVGQSKSDAGDKKVRDLVGEFAKDGGVKKLSTATPQVAAIGDLSLLVGGDNAVKYAQEDSDTSFSIIFGYEYMDDVSVEFGYVGLGEFENRVVGYVSGPTTIAGEALATRATGVSEDATLTIAETMDVDGWLLGIKADYEVMDNIDVFGRLGLFQWDGVSSISVTPNAAALVPTGDGASALTQEGLNTRLAAHIEAVEVEGDEDGTDFYLGLGATYMITEQVGLGVDVTRYFISEDVDMLSVRFIYKF